MNVSPQMLIGLQGAIAATVAGAFTSGAILLPEDQAPPKTTIAAVSTPHVRSESTMSEDSDGTAERALRQKIALLERGKAYLESISGYTAQFRKQELVDSELLEEQTMLLKCRHRPFSVYLHWLEANAGREVLFVEGQNDGKLHVHEGGWKSRLPTMALSPDSSLARSDSRYPVTQAGLLQLIEMMLAIHRQDLVTSNYAQCLHQEHVKFDGRDCDVFTTLYKSRKVSPEYRKSVTFIDRELGLPVSTKHFQWQDRDAELAEADLDDATLIEFYEFTELDFGQQLSDADFAATNEEYRFH